MKRIRILNFIDDREGREDVERELERLVNEGWEIKGVGGGGAAGLLWGFIILQFDEDTQDRSD